MSTPDSRRWLVAFVLVALVCAQALGLAHRVAHTPHEASEPRTAHTAALHHEHHHGEIERSNINNASQDHELGWLERLFSQHHDENDCRLYDSLSPQAFACNASLPIPVIAPPLAYVRVLGDGFVARWTALFDARGPPRSR